MTRVDNCGPHNHPHMGECDHGESFFERIADQFRHQALAGSHRHAHFGPHPHHGRDDDWRSESRRGGGADWRDTQRQVSGSIVGDPHFTGADGEHYDVQGHAGQTYNLLSDNGIEVNGRFQAYGDNGATTVGEMGITVRGDDGRNHRIDIQPGGKLEIDGQCYGNGCFLGGMVEKDGNTITVNTRNYDLKVTDGGGYLDTQIDANGARRPDGLWGQSLYPGSGVDTNAGDFRVARNNVFSTESEPGHHHHHHHHVHHSGGGTVVSAPPPAAPPAGYTPPAAPPAAPTPHGPGVAAPPTRGPGRVDDSRPPMHEA